jgi:hypothetical protein
MQIDVSKYKYVTSYLLPSFPLRGGSRQEVCHRFFQEGNRSVILIHTSNKNRRLATTMETENIIKGVLLVAVIWFIYTAFNPPSPEPKMGGEPCFFDEDCMIKQCIKEPGYGVGYCKFSTDGGVCKADNNCETDLKCRNGTCKRLSAWCSFRTEGPFFIIVGILVILLEFLGLKIGKVIHNNWTFVGPIIGIISLGFGIFLYLSC